MQQIKKRGYDEFQMVVILFILFMAYLIMYLNIIYIENSVDRLKLLNIDELRKDISNKKKTQYRRLLKDAEHNIFSYKSSKEAKNIKRKRISKDIEKDSEKIEKEMVKICKSMVKEATNCYKIIVEDVEIEEKLQKKRIKR